jgi:hypothetical protein
MRYRTEKQASCHPQDSEIKGRTMMRSRSRLLKVQHFAEEEACDRNVNPCAPVVYERRSKCKLKMWQSRIRHTAGLRRNTAVDGFGSSRKEQDEVREWKVTRISLNGASTLELE